LTKPTSKWLKKAEKYRELAKIAEQTGFKCDFSNEAANAMFNFESSGIGKIEYDNGYAIGKKWMDVQISMWIEDLQATKNMVPIVSIDEIPEEYYSHLSSDILQKANQSAFK
jgi:hypothetical protein